MSLKNFHTKIIAFMIFKAFTDPRFLDMLKKAKERNKPKKYKETIITNWLGFKTTILEEIIEDDKTRVEK